jgi:membrane protein DedA with SNARE-associated domain
MDPAQLAESIQHLHPALVYGVVVLWLSLESSGVPIPNEAILLFGGYLASTGQVNPVLVAAAGLTGSAIGATISYWIGYHLGYRGVRRFGRYILLTPHRLEAAEGWFHHRGRLTIFLARLTPVVRTVISYPAGIARMPYRGFLVSTICGAAIWCVFIVAVGDAVGPRWLVLFDWLHRAGLWAAAAVLLALAVYIVAERRLVRGR